MGELPYASSVDRVVAVLASLASLRSEMNYLFSNREEFARGIIARAFMHLQRMIVADPFIPADVAKPRLRPGRSLANV